MGGVISFDSARVEARHDIEVVVRVRVDETGRLTAEGLNEVAVSYSGLMTFDDDLEEVDATRLAIQSTRAIMEAWERVATAGRRPRQPGD